MKIFVRHSSRFAKCLNTFRYQLKEGARKATWARKGRVHPDAKISVIVPTLSRGEQLSHFPKLKRLLSEHLPSQTHSNYEAIVYSDGPNERISGWISDLKDERVCFYATPETIGTWGHPQTRLGITLATGDYFVRINDDNKPYPHYLETLVDGFGEDEGVVYGRLLYKEQARRHHAQALKDSYLIPGVRDASPRHQNIDCMNFMVRMDLARKYVLHWSDDYAADWYFLETLLKESIRARFIDRLIGEKH